ncbi:MAG: D-arabinono-1,4-lactone oxidase [Rhizomicrobium sp.]
MIIGCDRWSNWSGSVVCKPKKLLSPRDEVEVAAALRCACSDVRVAGSGMSSSPLCETNGLMLDLTAFDGLYGFDFDTSVATIGAGTPLWDIASLLHREGYALNNMGDSDRGTLGGQIAVGAHGSGWNLRSLSADVDSFTLVLTSGEVLHCSATENSEIFTAGRVALGLLGVMTEIGMKVRPRYKLVKTYFVHSVDETFRQLDGLAQANRHFEFFWFPHNETIVCKSLNETTARAPEPRSSAAMRARGERPNMKSFAVTAINELMRLSPVVVKPAHRILPILRKSFGRVRWSNETFPSPRVMRFNEMEYAVPYEKGPDAVREIAEAIRKKKIVTGLPLVYRIVEADDIWMSPFYGRKSAAISIPQYYRHASRPLFETCEEIFRRYDGRPHWGKIHSMTAGEAASLYPHYDDFRAMRSRLDPAGKFLNRHLREVLPV